MRCALPSPKQKKKHVRKSNAATSCQGQALELEQSSRAAAGDDAKWAGSTAWSTSQHQLCSDDEDVAHGDDDDDDDGDVDDDRVKANLIAQTRLSWCAGMSTLASQALTSRSTGWMV